MSNQTNAERISDEVDAAIAAGQDPFGDNDPIPETGGFDEPEAGATETQATGSTEGDEDGAQDAGKSAETGDDPGQTAEPAATEASAEPAVAAPAEPIAQPHPAGPDLATLTAKLDKLLDDKTAVEREWAAGNLGDDERLAQLRALDRQAFAVNRQLALAEAAEAAEAQAASVALADIKAQALTQGLDYTKHPAAAKQFDMAMDLLDADPESARLSIQERMQKAHATVAALNGIAAKPAAQPAAQAAAPAKPRTTPPIPTTLRGVPAAAAQVAGSTLAEQMGRLKGAAYQSAFANLSSKQQAELLGED